MERTLTYVLIFFGCAFYFIIGMMLSLPYCLAAGWDKEMWLTMSFAVPLMLFVWTIFAFFAKVVDVRPTRVDWKNAFRRSSKDASSIPLGFFWTWTIYSMLPIIFHQSSRLLGTLGFDSSAAFLEVHRYESLGYVFWAVMVLMIVLMFAGGVADAIARLHEAKMGVPTRND